MDSEESDLELYRVPNGKETRIEDVLKVKPHKEKQEEPKAKNVTGN